MAILHCTSHVHGTNGLDIHHPTVPRRIERECIHVTCLSPVCLFTLSHFHTCHCHPSLLLASLGLASPLSHLVCWVFTDPYHSLYRFVVSLSGYAAPWGATVVRGLSQLLAPAWLTTRKLYQPTRQPYMCRTHFTCLAHIWSLWSSSLSLHLRTTSIRASLAHRLDRPLADVILRATFVPSTPSVSSRSPSPVSLRGLSP